MDNIITNWYTKPEVKFEIIRFTKNREFAFISPSAITPQLTIRKLRVHSVQNLDYAFKISGLRFDNNILNLYYSLSQYDDGVIMRYNVSNDILDNWWKNHYNKMTGYDFLIDIDCKDIDDLNYAQNSTLSITGLFDKLDVPYELRYSGFGFHIIIPTRYINIKKSFNPVLKDNIYRCYNNIATYLFNHYSELIDRKIYDSRRVVKVPYSLAYYDIDNIYVCLSINNITDLKHFNINDYRPNNVKSIKNRGVHIFNPNGNFNNLLEHCNIK